MFEAMANKIPVLAPDIGGFAEVLGENNCGIVYSPGNMEDAEDKLLNLINDAGFRKELGENGRVAINQSYNAHNFIKQIEHAYFNLVK
jgi:glycosyltransferase involved in cell wall biosynthesis